MKKRVLLAMLALVVSVAFATGRAYAIGKQYERKGAEIVEGGKDAKPYKDPAQMDEATYKKPPKEEKKKVKASDFPEKGWHKGPYVAAMVGMMQFSKNRHIVTDIPFDGKVGPAFGLAFGWDIADWIGPLLQMSYSTSTGTAGDANNGNNNGAAYAAGEYPQYTFPAATFPSENARQHVLDFSLFAKATLPYFTRAEWQPKMVKIIPFAKLGGTGHALFVNAPTNANKIGAFGGGPAIGVGCEFFIWKGFFMALDFTEHLVIQAAYSRSITTANAGVQSLKLTKSGFNPHFTFNGMFGWHF